MIDFLFLDHGNEYQITDWTSSRVTAQNETPCFTALMTVDIEAEQVTTVTVPRPNPSTCSGLPDYPIARNWSMALALHGRLAKSR